MFENPEFPAEVQRRLPTRELATVEQVADAVRYLACDASGSVTPGASCGYEKLKALCRAAARVREEIRTPAAAA